MDRIEELERKLSEAKRSLEHWQCYIFDNEHPQLKKRIEKVKQLEFDLWVEKWIRDRLPEVMEACRGFK